MVNENVIITIETNEASKQIDPYCCAIQIKSSDCLVTVGHIPREISRHCYFFMTEEGGKIDGHVLSTAYRPSPIPSGGLEIPLLLRFYCPKFLTYTKMKKFITTLYDFSYTGKKNTDENSSDEENEDDICFTIDEEKPIEKKEVSSSSDEEVFKTSKNKRKRVKIEISDDSE